MKEILNIIVFCIISQSLLAQYTVNGNAQQVSCNCYDLTQEVTNQSGSVWNNNKINLTQSFDFKFDINLGRFDANGADGMAFVLQPISTSVGSTGGGLGYNGITPAVGVTIDTYQNGNNNDPVFDHIAIQLNGDLNHNSINNIAGPVTALNGNDNIEDNNNHSLRIQWDAVTKTLTVYVDGILRVSAVKDFVTDVFSGAPLVYWGFTAGTGGSVNLQKFCTALNPAFHFAPNQKRCVNEPVTFYDSTISFTTIAKFYWNFGDGSPVDSINLNPVHIYTVAGDYTVIQRVIGADGCEATNTQVVRIGSKPTAYFTRNNNHCIPMPPYPPVIFSDSSYTTVGTINNWYWDFDNGQTSTNNGATINYTTTGDKTIKLAVKTLEGCESDTLYKVIHMFSQPVLDFTFTDSVCLGSPTSFFGIVISSGDPITNWLWFFPDTLIRTQNTTYTFTTPGNHPILFAATSSGNVDCLGGVTKNVFVVNKPTAYFKNNSICQSVLITLQDSSYNSDGVAVTGWWWDLGNGQFSTQQNPSVTYNATGPITIRHVVYNSKGCISDTLTQTINVSAKPVANFAYSKPLCGNLPIQFSDSSVVAGGGINKWSWIYNGIEWSALQNPDRTFTVGLQTVKLLATSNAGCVSDTVFKTFYVNPEPNVTMNFNDACKNALVNFTAIDNSGTVTDWKWTFGDGGIANTKDAQHGYTANGTYPVKLFATAPNGCYNGSLQKDIIIYSTNVFAGNDIIAAPGQPVQLKATGGISYLWSPAIGLNNATIANPVATVLTTQTFTVKAFTPQGCETYDDVTVKIYKGPDIYLPNAFTPNGINNLYRGLPVGIKEFRYLKIYNRYGQLVFYSTDVTKGWDGSFKGKAQNSGVYIVIASGIDYRGLVVDRQATVMLIR